MFQHVINNRVLVVKESNNFCGQIVYMRVKSDQYFYYISLYCDAKQYLKHTYMESFTFNLCVNSKN